ncbi:MAG: YggT family protein, partial [Rickettsiales bacterium]|nr:YggT family protein [Rickettsiales bacterium]
MNPFINLISMVLTLYMWAMIIYVILGWLAYFNVVNRHNAFVARLGDALHRLINPVLSRIRRFVPVMGGLDLSPIILIILIFFIRDVLYT